MRRFLFFILVVLSVGIGWVALYGKKSFTSQSSLSMNVPLMNETSVTLKEIHTPAGYQIWLAPADIPVVTVGVAFLGAGQRCSFKTPGLVELLVSLLDEGAGPYNSQAFKTRLLEKNIQLSINANQDNIVITLRTIKSNVKDALELLQLMLTAPRFDEDDMVRVKQQMVSNLEQSLHYPEVVGREALQRFMLDEDHPYRPDTLARIKNIPAITREQLCHYMEQNFTKQSVRVVAAGDISLSELTDCVDKTFASLKPGELQPNGFEAKFRNLGQTLTIDMDVPQSVIYFAQPSLSRHHPDFYAFFVVNRILGNAFESRLWHEVREKRGLAYFCSTGLSTADLANTLTGVTATKTETVQQTIQIIKQEWQRLVDHGIDARELEFHKKNTTGAYALNFGSTIEIVNILLGYCQQGLAIDAVNQRNKMIQKLTVEDMNRVIQHYLKPNDLIFVRVGRPVSEPSSKP